MKLYRFEKNEPRRCDTISNNMFWISAPSEFNDLDDCRISGKFIKPLAPKEHDKILKGLELFYPEESKLEDVIFSKETIQQLKDFISPHCYNGNNLRNDLYSAKAFIEIRNEIQSTTGVCCFFSGSTDNALMWAHYADSHKGFYIEYEVDEDKTLNLFEVTYSSQLPAPSITELLFSPKETFRRIVTTKKMEWNYEKEWRFVYPRALKPDDKGGKNIALPDSMKPIRIITGAKYNPDQNTNKNFAVDMAEKLGIERLTYDQFKTQI